MLATCVAVLGSPDAPRFPGTPELTCVPEQVRITTDGPRRRTFSPLANDFTNDGSAIYLDTVQALDAGKGSLTRNADDTLTYEAESFAGTFDLAYTARSATGAVAEGTIAFIVEGITIPSECQGAPDTIILDPTATTVDFDVLANDTGSGSLEIMPGSLVQPPSGPTIAILNGKIRVTRNGAGTGDYLGSYRPRLVDGSAVGDATAITIRISSASVTAPDFTVTVPLGAAQPWKIDALARCSGTSAIELTPGGITQPNGNNDSAAITGSGATGYIDYTRGTTPVGEYTMRYRARLIANTGVEATGTITIQVRKAYWLRPLAGGREWPAGPGYHDNNTSLWTGTVGARGAWTSQTMSATSRSSWAKTWGGSDTENINNLTHLKDGQTDTSKAVWQVMKASAPGKEFITLVHEMIPDGYFQKADGSWDEKDVRLYDYIDSNTSTARAGYERYGNRIGLACYAMGIRDPDMIWCRPSHEMNQTNTLRVWASTRARYRYSMERAFKWMRTGFARVYPNARLRFIHSPGRTSNLGPFHDWIPQDSEGGVDALTVSFHPAQQVSSIATYDQFLDRWDNSSYGVLRDLEPACALLGLPIAEVEWSPRYEYRKDKNGKVTKQPCTAADIVVQQYTKHLRKNYRDGILVYETPYDQKQFIKTAYEGPDAAGKAAWSRMVDDMTAIYMGSPKGTPPSLQVTGGTTVSLPGSTLDFDAIGACTGSQGVRLSRIVSAGGGLKASITGSGATAKVKIDRNTAGSGKKTVVAEVTLANINYLLDVEITVNIP